MVKTEADKLLEKLETLDPYSAKDVLRYVIYYLEAAKVNGTDCVKTDFLMYAINTKTDREAAR